MTAKLYRVEAKGELGGKKWGYCQLVTEAEVQAGVLPMLIARMADELPCDGAERLSATWTCEPWNPDGQP